MLVLHTHWQPPRTTTETGGVLFWAETYIGFAPCAGYIAHPSEYLGNGDAMSLKIGYYAGQS